MSLTLVACSPKDALTPSGTSKEVAATVNGTAIPSSLVDVVAKQMAQGRPESPELRKGAIDQLTLQLLVAQEATKKGLDKTPEVADQITLMGQSILANAYVQDYFKNNPVSDDQLKAEYEQLQIKMAGNEYKARHILVEKEADAKAIIAALKKHAKAFAALAKEKSKDPGSKGNGGDLGWFDPRGMVPEFSTAVAKLAKGQFTTEPVKSQFGYHVILLDDSRTKAIPSLEELKPRLQQQVQQQNLKKFFDDLKAKAKIEIAKAPEESKPVEDKKAAEEKKVPEDKKAPEEKK
jgi:peptidyl-prolyl cis-trans isomerase C